MMQINPLLRFAVSIEDAADAASVSVSTVRRAIAAGDLRAAKLGTAVRIRVVDLDQWLAAAARSPVAAVVPLTAESNE